MPLVKNDKHRFGFLCVEGHDYENTGTSLFYKSTGRCVECQRAHYRKHYLKNSQAICAHIRNYRASNEGKEKRIILSKKYRLENKEKIIAKDRRYYKQNKKLIQSKYYKYCKMHRKLKTQMATRERLRGHVYQAMIKYAKTGKIWTSQQYGIDYEAIIAHLGPHPNTRGIKGDFHIDHIIPLSAFDLNDPEQIKLAFAPGNHQWLRAKDNISKHDHVEGQLNLMTQKQLEVVILKA